MRNIHLARLCVILFALILASPVRAVNKYALLVGIDEYQQKDMIASLGFASADARGVAKALQEVAGFSEENIRLLVSDGEKKPTKANIVFELSNLEESVKKDDIVFILFSGHGMEREGVTYFLPWDADARNESTLKLSALQASDVIDTLSRLKAKAVIVAYDMCRNDPIRGGSRGVEVGRANKLSERQATRDLVLKPATDGSGPLGVATLFSCSPQQRSWEWPERQRGFFSYFLERGLRGEAAENGTVRMRTLISYLEQKVPSAVLREKGQKQDPYPRLEGPGIMELVLAQTANDEERKKIQEEEERKKQLELERLKRIEEEKRKEAERIKDEERRKEELKRLEEERRRQEAQRLEEERKAKFNALFQSAYELYTKAAYAEAEKQLSEAITYNPNSAPAAHLMGEIYYHLRQYDKAGSLYKRAMEIDPNYPDPINGYANVLSEKGNLKEAERYFRLAMEKAPTEAWIPRNLGYAYWQKKRFDDAASQFKKAMELEPRWSLPANDLATYYLVVKRDYAEAERYYRQAIDLNPDEGSYHANLAQCLFVQNRLDDARAEANLALQKGYRDSRHPIWKALGINP